MYPNDLIPGTGFDLYNLFLGLGLVVCFLFLWFSLKKTGFNFDAISAIFITGLFAVSIGIFSAMLFQSIYDFIADPSGGFRLTGKMTYLGGVIGGAASYLIIYNLYMHVIAPCTKIKWLQNNANAGLCDALPVIPTCIVLATAIGRIGCFFAGCCAGNPTDGSWGLACSQTYEGVKVVPVQLFFISVTAFTSIFPSISLRTEFGASASNLPAATNAADLFRDSPPRSFGALSWFCSGSAISSSIGTCSKTK